jgi:hypothetical protein
MIMSMKNSSDTIGNRTRDIPAFSAMLQPTVKPRAPKYYVAIIFMKVSVVCPYIGKARRVIQMWYE